MSDPTQPPGVPEMLELAQKAANATDWNRASDLLADAPEEVRVLDKRAFYLSRAKRYEEALALLAILRAKEPANFLWPHMTGYQFYVQGLYGEAVPWLLAAYRLNPKHLRNLYRLAQARRHQGELLRAKRAAGEVLKLWHALPTDAQERESKTLAKASYLLGQLQADKDPSGALDLFRQAVEHDPGDHDKHYRLGKTHRRLGQPREAVAALTRARRIKPRCIYIELELADALRLTGETETAFRHLATAMPGARGWQALKASRIAHELGRNDDAARMLHVAARDRKVSRSPLYLALKQKLPSVPSRKPSERERRRPRSGKAAVIAVPDAVSVAHTGKVDHVRPAKGFGFLVDDADGERCYFRLPSTASLSDGQPVRFRRADTKRGPAARDVQVTV
ncbi:MAG TPA: tetratricopeptide repeat protein [Solirubrobacteraceae bacterium]|jgi:tetratricopeptide (TPR) repeat protein/cold shock CspA family protein|nr:tetratricopeptide repeat protein [Solirubrobacteraceae bacterium]